MIRWAIGRPIAGQSDWGKSFLKCAFIILARWSTSAGEAVKKYWLNERAKRERWEIGAEVPEPLWRRIDWEGVAADEPECEVLRFPDGPIYYFRAFEFLGD